MDLLTFDRLQDNLPWLTSTPRLGQNPEGYTTGSSYNGGEEIPLFTECL